jgi:hypothetical protein
MRSASSAADGYCDWMNETVRTTAGRPAWVFQSASRWKAGAIASLVTIT